MKDVCAINHQVTDFSRGFVLLCSCALVELDCSTRCSGVSWKVTCEIGCDRESVNALRDLESLLVAGSMSDYRDLWWGRWEGKRDGFMVGLEG